MAGKLATSRSGWLGGSQELGVCPGTEWNWELDAELIPKWLVYGIYPPIKGGYPLVNVYIAMEAMAHRKSVDLPIDSMAIFQFANC